MSKKHYLKVLLDEKAIIVNFESTLKDVETDLDVIGKNWFDTFIKSSDKKEIMEVFTNIMTHQINKYNTYRNNVKFGNQHKRINFKNSVIIKDGKKYLDSYGVEDYDYTSQLQSVDNLLTPIEEKINSMEKTNYNLQNFKNKLQVIKIKITDDHSIEPSLIDAYIEKISNEIKTYNSEK